MSSPSIYYLWDTFMNPTKKNKAPRDQKFSFPATESNFIVMIGI